MIDDDLRRRVRAWIDQDPDPKTQEELRALLRHDDEPELRDRFQGPLTFGTAGLRGLIGGGPYRMNRAVVLRATAGLCAWLLEQVPDAKERGVCIGYDGRRMSQEFAGDAAAVIAANGIVARVFPHVCPTPLLGFAVLDKNAAGGIVITASHNPPAYNGYKVFWGNGAQIVPPHDGGIADEIAAVGRACDIPRMGADVAKEKGLLDVMDEGMVRRYLDGVHGLQVHPKGPRDLRVTYTAMHGVGEKFVRASFYEAGFTELSTVAAQAEPDGEFPTVEFPNPEEDGAMDLALEAAVEHEAELVLANDPDADRLAAAVLSGDGYRMLSGNEIGCFLAHYLLDEGDQSGERFVLSSVVSSPMIGSIAESQGVHWEPTLTGHKWINNRALELEAKGMRYVFGYEEALGYGCGSLVRDKDGIGAALVFADAVAYYKSQGKSALDVLEEMARRYGLYLSEQVSIVLPGEEGKAQIASMMERVREAPPKSVAGITVLTASDLSTGDKILADGTKEALPFPKSNVLSYDLEGGHRIMARPSGTEPKLKLYFDVRVDLGDGESVAGGQTRGAELVANLMEAFRVQVEG